MSKKGSSSSDDELKVTKDTSSSVENGGNEPEPAPAPDPENPETEAAPPAKVVGHIVADVFRPSIPILA